MNSLQTPPSAPYLGAKLHGQVTHELGRRIVGGLYPPGSRLPNEEDLCLELGVSRSALREATKALAAKRLIESRPRIGTTVRAPVLWNTLDPDVLAWRCATLPDARFFAQLTEMREMIEPHGAALAARHRSAQQLAAMQSAYQRMADSATLEEWVEADLAFHSALLHASNNLLLIPLVAVIGSALETLLSQTARRATDFKIALPEHKRVLDAVAHQDANAAFHGMSLLLTDTRRRVPEWQDADIDSTTLLVAQG
jgi:DNA-binding FadR family transcriptional regulator